MCTFSSCCVLPELLVSKCSHNVKSKGVDKGAKEVSVSDSLHPAPSKLVFDLWIAIIVQGLKVYPWLLQNSHQLIHKFKF